MLHRSECRKCTEAHISVTLPPDIHVTLTYSGVWLTGTAACGSTFLPTHFSADQNQRSMAAAATDSPLSVTLSCVLRRVKLRDYVFVTKEDEKEEKVKRKRT